MSRSRSVQGGSHHDEIKFVTTTKLDRFNVGDVLAKTTFFMSQKVSLKNLRARWQLQLQESELV